MQRRKPGESSSFGSLQGGRQGRRGPTGRESRQGTTGRSSDGDGGSRWPTVTDERRRNPRSLGPWGGGSRLQAVQLARESTEALARWRSQGGTLAAVLVAQRLHGQPGRSSGGSWTSRKNLRTRETGSQEMFRRASPAVALGGDDGGHGGLLRRGRGSGRRGFTVVEGEAGVEGVEDAGEARMDRTAEALTWKMTASASREKERRRLRGMQEDGV